jgi:hypothetical protein
LLRVLQVKQCGTNINKIYNITLLRENTIQENQEYTKRTPKNTKRSSKVSLYCSKKDYEMAPKITRENEREWRRVGRDFGIITLVWNFMSNEAGGIPFIWGREERPLLDELRVSLIQERENKSRREHF